MGFLLLLLLLAPPNKRYVVLTWEDTLNQRIATYNVYRGDGSCNNTPPLSLLATEVVPKTWTDSDVKQNKTYCYAVTAVNTGLESTAASITVDIPRPNMKETK
jgi:fibronectin type 3 domain-containing protein